LIPVDARSHPADRGFNHDDEQVIVKTRGSSMTAVVPIGEALHDAERDLKLSTEHGFP
jgi:hypothetical protein